MPRIYPSRSYGVMSETNGFKSTKGQTYNTAKTLALTWTDQVAGRVATGPTSSSYPTFNFLGPGSKLGWRFDGVANNMSLDSGFLGQFINMKGITWQAKIRPGDYPNGSAETYFFFLSDGGTANGSVGRFAVGPVGNTAANQIVITGRRLDGGTRFVDYVGTGANTGSFWTTGEEFILTVTADYTGNSFGDGSKVVYSVWKNENLIYRQNVSTFNSGSNDTTTAPAKTGASTTPFAGTLGGSVVNSKYGKGIIGDWNVMPFLWSDSEIISKVAANKTESQLGTIQITSPQHGQAFQKGASGTQNIAISGTYTGNPTSITASFKGGTPQVIVASPSGGSFSGTLTAQAAGQGDLKVWFTNDTSNYCIRRKVLVTDVFALVGQSNNTDATDTNFSIAGPKTYSMPTTMGPTVFNSRYNYANWNDTTLCQNYIVGLGQNYYNKNGYPCAFIYAAIGGTNIDKWQPGNTNALYGNVDGSVPNNNNPQSGGDTFGLGTNLFNRSVAMINQACPTGIRALLWHQGEADAGGGVSTATYNTKLTAIANAYQSAFPSAYFLPCNLQIIRGTNNAVISTSLIMTARAQVVAAGYPNVLDGPDFSDLECDFQGGTGYFHLLNDTVMTQVSNRWFAKVDALPAYVDPVAPAPDLNTYNLLASQFTAANSQKMSKSDSAALSGGNFDFWWGGFVVFDAVNVQQCVVSKGTAIGGTTCEFALFLLNTGTIRMSISNGTTTTSANWGTPLTAGTIYFVEGYYDSALDRVRINVNRGTSVGVAQNTGSWDSTFDLNFGSSGSADYLGGRLWSWGYYNAIPSTTVMNSLYNNGIGKTYADLSAGEKTNLVAWWDFGSTSGNEIDKTAGGSDLTPTVSRPTSVQAGNSAITLTSPVANQVVQRRIGQMVGDITIKGTYYGSPTRIQASYNGGTYKDINATATNGVFTGILTSQAVANGGSVAIRFSSNNSITASQAIGGLGIVIALLGQSNCSGRGTNNQTFTAGLANAFMLGNDYVLKTLVDPTDSSTSQIDTVSSEAGAAGGSVWPLVATSLVSTNAVPIMFIPCAKGGSAISQWQPGVNHQDRTTLYGSAVYRTLLYSGVEFGIWWQGETDAQNAVSQASYKASFDSLVSAWNTDTGTKLMPAKIQNCTAISAGNQANINNAIAQEWSGNSLVLQGPDLTGVTTDSGDGLHLNADAKLSQAANLWIPVLKTATGLS